MVDDRQNEILAERSAQAGGQALGPSSSAHVPQGKDSLQNAAFRNTEWSPPHLSQPPVPSRPLIAAPFLPLSISMPRGRGQLRVFEMPSLASLSCCLCGCHKVRRRHGILSVANRLNLLNAPHAWCATVVTVHIGTALDDASTVTSCLANASLDGPPSISPVGTSHAAKFGHLGRRVTSQRPVRWRFAMPSISGTSTVTTLLVGGRCRAVAQRPFPRHHASHILAPTVPGTQDPINPSSTSVLAGPSPESWHSTKSTP